MKPTCYGFAQQEVSPPFLAQHDVALADLQDFLLLHELVEQESDFVMQHELKAKALRATTGRTDIFLITFFI